MLYNKVIGEIKLSGDKSIAHRLLILSSHIKGIHKIRNFPKNEDVLTTLEILSKYGLEYNFTNNGNISINSKNVIFKKRSINCNNSGTTARLFCGYLSGLNVPTKIYGDQSLSNRPMARVVNPLIEFGNKIISNNGK